MSRKGRNWIIVAGLVVGLPLLFIASHYPPLGGLTLPCPPKGRVVDSDTGEPIMGAVVSVKWQVYDYPMLDGAGSYTVSVQATTDRNGMVVLPRPNHRNGFFNTEGLPPYIRAKGYGNFTEWPELVRWEGDMFVCPLQPLKRTHADE